MTRTQQTLVGTLALTIILSAGAAIAGGKSRSRRYRQPTPTQRTSDRTSRASQEDTTASFAFRSLAVVRESRKDLEALAAARRAAMAEQSRAWGKQAIDLKKKAIQKRAEAATNSLSFGDEAADAATEDAVHDAVNTSTKAAKKGKKKSRTP